MEVNFVSGSGPVVNHGIEKVKGNRGRKGRGGSFKKNSNKK